MFDAVIHFAALADVADSVVRPQLYYDTNVAKMETLLKIMAEYDVRQIIFSSSAAVYGNPVYLPIDEKHPLNPINPYGSSKMQGEELLQKYEKLYGIRSVSLRYFNAAGTDPERCLGESHHPEHHLIPSMLQAILQRGKPLEIFGSDYDTRDGTCIRDFIHVMDLAEAHYLALEHLLSDGASDCFNLGSGKGYTILEIIQACEEITGRQVPYRFSGRRPGDPAVLLASNEKIKESLKWEPSFSDIYTIISTAWDWERNRLY
jgi:UDP-glucose 4-epimerase